MPANNEQINKLINREKAAAQRVEDERIAEQRRQHATRQVAEQAELQSKIEIILRNKDPWIDAMLAAGSPGLKIFIYRKIIKYWGHDEITKAEAVAWPIHTDTGEMDGHYHGTDYWSNTLLLAPDGEFFLEPWSSGGWSPTSQLSIEDVAKSYNPNQLIEGLLSTALRNGVAWQPVQ